ncbi:MAG: DUF1844 domain-containing protein [Pirellulales bacterium]|nr:DUF1844 domain-containing protein [Pirellulales bacterium]
MSSETDKPKIIIDEDWKSQAEAEKEAARAEAASPTPASPDPQASTLPLDQSAEPADAPLPPATLTFLFTTIATQAMIALGQVPNPINGIIEFRQYQAKHYIDTLSMLEAKTANNRTPEESMLLNDMLHQLRMAYILSMNAAPIKN